MANHQLDLASYVSGITYTAPFTPGANTISIVAGPHIGLTDGNSVATSSRNMAEIYNRLNLQIASAIVGAGLTYDSTNWGQLYTAIQTIVNTGLATVPSLISGGNVAYATNSGYSATTAITPNSSGTNIGAWVVLGGNYTSGGGIPAVLPPGGTWAWFAQVIWDDGNVTAITSYAGVSAGGTTVATGGMGCQGFAWRIA
jgi:hypothetical protein